MTLEIGPWKQLFTSLITELIGTCLLVVMGCGSILAAILQNQNETEKIDLTGIALCWGITVATLAHGLGKLGNCHFNPAITLALTLAGKLHFLRAAVYIPVQCVGATAGAQLLKLLTPKDVNWIYGVTQIRDGVTVGQGLVTEILATFLLMIIILGATDKGSDTNQVKYVNTGSAPLAIGLCVTALVLFCGPTTGASMNPARSFGPSLVSGRWEDHWVFWVGPVTGAVFAAVLYQMMSFLVLVTPSTSCSGGQCQCEGHGQCRSNMNGISSISGGKETSSSLYTIT